MRLGYHVHHKHMNTATQKLVAVVVVLAFMLLLPESAQAFRCGSKLVKEGMHEAQVVAVCGEPTTRRDLGVAVRYYDYRYYRKTSPGWSSYKSPGYGHLASEVIITEYTYNFGPRKLMRRLVFEGGILETIETIGYGYIE
jgi:hypothetical protein